MSKEQAIAEFSESLSKLTADELSTKCIDLFEKIQNQKSEIKNLNISLEARVKYAANLEEKIREMKKPQEEQKQQNLEQDHEALKKAESKLKQRAEFN